MVSSRVRITTANPLVLGSASPRRRELLESLGLPLVVRVADVDESQRAGEAAHQYLERVVAAKLEAVREDLARGPSPLDHVTAAGEPTSLRDGRGILVADTIVVAPDGLVLGKPSGDEQALAMLGKLSGAVHEVKTRFALAESVCGAPILHAETVVTGLRFRALAPDEAREYVTSGEGRDKAGGYAVQGKAASFVQRIEGSYTNVVGLPLCEVATALRALGWTG
jgi:septum formation protein